MIFTESEATIRVTFSKEEWAEFLILQGALLSWALLQKETDLAAKQLDFMNRMNRTNPKYTPYAIEGLLERFLDEKISE